MKPIFVLIVLVLALYACQGNANSGKESAQSENTVLQVAPENLVTISFDVEGMTCTGCESTVVRSLESLDGVVEANASHESGKASVQFDKTLVTKGEMEDGIVSTGYRVTGYTGGE